MKLAAFRFDLPQELIAKYPVEHRDESRLMVIDRAKGTIAHRHFKDLVEYLDQGDTLVMNDTKVFSSRLMGNKEKTGAMVEVFLLRELNPVTCLWDTLVDPARKIRVGNKLYFGDGELVAEVLDNTTSRGRTLKFLFEGTREAFYALVEQLGEAPLPEELQRQVEPEDKQKFQTIYAKELGAVTAPCAGLHFTPHLFKRLELQGVDITALTLHVGLGMLKTIDVEDLTKYRVDSECFEVREDTQHKVNASLAEKKRVCAVGASTLKALESVVTTENRVQAARQWTNRFIYPPYDFRIANALITNFHLPESVPLVQAAAFTGYDLLMEAYQEALREKYRFYVYGDAMLIL